MSLSLIFTNLPVDCIYTGTYKKYGGQQCATLATNQLASKRSSHHQHLKPRGAPPGAAGGGQHRRRHAPQHERRHEQSPPRCSLLRQKPSNLVRSRPPAGDKTAFFRGALLSRVEEEVYVAIRRAIGLINSAWALKHKQTARPGGDQQV